MAGVWLAQTRGTFTTVAERLKPESLYRRFIEYRESLGFEVLPLSGGDRPPFEVLCERLRANRVVCLMAERDLTRTGVEVDFFGEPTRMPAGPAKLAIETGAALLPGALLESRKTPGPSRYTRRWTAPAATSTPSPRRWPTNSPPTSPPTPKTGTCCSPSGWPICPSQARPAAGGLMRIGMVCPYSFDVPGGVQSHVLQLAEVLRERGHEVSVLAPASPHVSAARLCRLRRQGRPDSLQRFGGAAAVRSRHPRQGQKVAGRRRLRRPAPARTQRAEPVHVALRIAEGPIVATFHTSTTKSLTLSVFQSLLRPLHEKIVGRIAVSDLARRWQMEALGTDAVEIPNGVDVASFASAPRLDGYPRRGQDGAVPGPLRRAPQGHGGAARRAAAGGRALPGSAAADRRPRR